MRQSKLKWVVGGLMLGTGGVLALAGLPSRGDIAACEGAPPALPVPMVSQPLSEPPVSLPAPKPSDLPTPPAPSVPAPATIPVIDPPKTVEVAKPATVDPKPLELPKLEAPLPSKPDVVIPVSGSTPAIPSPVAPTPAPATIPAAPPTNSIPTNPTPTASPSTPTILPNPIDGLPAPINPEPSKPTTTPPSSIAPQFPTTPPGANSTTVDLKLEATPPAPKVQPETKIEVRPTPATPAMANEPVVGLEKKLKVVLHLGDERPRFEVRDGDEVYLKVICDRVDVKSPSDKGEMMSILRAAGKVMFVTPGGEGICEELALVPGKGQVQVMGKVSFKYNWGKAETVVSGTEMTFRLGTMPGISMGSSTLPASFTK